MGAQVDLAEHRRVQMLAEAAEASRAATETQKAEVLAECEKARADHAKMERNFKAAKAQIEQVYNPEKLHHSEWKSRRAEERKKIEGTGGKRRGSILKGPWGRRGSLFCCCAGVSSALLAVEWGERNNTPLLDEAIVAAGFVWRPGRDSRPHAHQPSLCGR